MCLTGSQRQVKHLREDTHLSLPFQQHSNLSKMQSFSYKEQSLLRRYSWTWNKTFMLFKSDIKKSFHRQMSQLSAACTPKHTGAGTSSAGSGVARTEPPLGKRGYNRTITILRTMSSVQVGPYNCKRENDPRGIFSVLFLFPVNYNFGWFFCKL